MIPVIICGGFGTKLWPLSREHSPKHFLPLINNKSLFQHNYEALLEKFNSKEIYVSTNKDQIHFVHEQAPDIPEDNFILEPEMRNQGPATCLIAATLYKKGFKDEPFMLIQADVLREPTADFIKMINACDEVARKENKYLTGGFKLKEVIMGVDYLRKGEKVNHDNVGIFEVSEFIWRSSEEETQKMVEKGDVLVHTNHTCMTPKSFLEMIKKYKKEWYEPMLSIINGGDINIEFLKMPTGPLEDVTQKVHENSESLVVELPFSWSDFGTFQSVSNYVVSHNLYNKGQNIVELESENNYVKLDDGNKVVALIGVRNMIVVDTGDVLLICDNTKTSKVKEAREEVKKRQINLI